MDKDTVFFVYYRSRVGIIGSRYKIENVKLEMSKTLTMGVMEVVGKRLEEIFL